MADLMRLFAGEFHSVYSFVSNEFWNFNVEDNAYALMRSENRVVAMLHSSATQWQHRFRMEMTLEKGALILSGILSGSKSYGDETLTVVSLDDGPQGAPRENTTQYHHDPSKLPMFRDLVSHSDTTGTNLAEAAAAQSASCCRWLFRPRLGQRRHPSPSHHPSWKVGVDAAPRAARTSAEAVGGSRPPARLARRQALRPGEPLAPRGVLVDSDLIF